jgi:hypothetical protein
VATVVELQLFAGRPNPRWVLPPVAEARFRQRVEQLNEPAEPPPRAGLGYQGLVVYEQGAGARWLPWLHVFNGTISVLRGPAPLVYRDTEGVEECLLAQAERADLDELVHAALLERKRGTHER